MLYYNHQNRNGRHVSVKYARHVNKVSRTNECSVRAYNSRNIHFNQKKLEVNFNPDRSMKSSRDKLISHSTPRNERHASHIPRWETNLLDCAVMSCSKKTINFEIHHPIIKLSNFFLLDEIGAFAEKEKKSPQNSLFTY